MNGVNCLICGYRTLHERGGFEICLVCYWEDDGEYDDPTEIAGGSNGDLSLTSARENFRRIGAVSVEMLQHVREPLSEEQVEGLPSTEEIKLRQTEARKAV